MHGKWKRWMRSGMLVALVPFSAGACHHHRSHHKMSDAEVEERVEERTEDALDWLDATDEQSTQVSQVVKQTLPDLKAFRQEHETLRNEFRQALEVEKVDRDQLEGLRVNALDLLDRASARLLLAFADVADILTVEQRRKVTEKWKRH